VQCSESINGLTATASAIQVQVNGSPVTPVSVTYNSSQSVTITPFGPSPDNTKVTISVSGVMDDAGNAVVPFASSFTTGAIPVLTGHVPRTSPVLNAVNVPLNAVITVETDDPVDPSSVNGNGFGASDANGAITGTLSISASGKVISFAPATPFLPSDKISFYASLLDLKGNYISVPEVTGKAVTGYGTFTTSSAAVTTPPSVTLVNPPNGLAGVPTDIVPQLLFNEPLNASTMGAIALSQGGTNLALTTIIGNGNQTVSLIPPGLLQPSTAYAVTEGAVADTAGNMLAPPVRFSFTTGTGASLGIPSAVSFSPANNATGVPLSATVTVVFSPPLNPLTLSATSFGLFGSGFIAGSLSLSADGLTVTFTPSVALNPNSTFEILISANGSTLTDVAGNAVVANATFFTTGAQ